MDALQWMGAVRMRVQTADKNITMIHKVTPVHQLTSCDIKIFMFIMNKSIIKAFLTLNHHFWIKYESIIMLPPVKKSIFCCPLTSKSTHIFVWKCFELFLLETVWSVHISLLMQMKRHYHWRSNTLARGLVFWKYGFMMDLFLTKIDLNLFKWRKKLI